jgi:hypothetical protein
MSSILPTEVPGCLGINFGRKTMFWTIFSATLLAIWAACGIVAATAYVAYPERKAQKADYTMVPFMALSGPFGLGMIIGDIAFDAEKPT